jgi:hypothetical protein
MACILSQKSQKHLKFAISFSKSNRNVLKKIMRNIYSWYLCEPLGRGPGDYHGLGGGKEGSRGVRRGLGALQLLHACGGGVQTGRLECEAGVMAHVAVEVV